MLDDAINTWLEGCRAPGSDPIQSMRQAGLLEPTTDYATIARLKPDHGYAKYCSNAVSPYYSINGQRRMLVRATPRSREPAR